MSDQTTAMIVNVTGRVQGVGFRAWTKSEAEARGLSGWVRNEPDGSVSALIEGPGAQVATMLKALEKRPARRPGRGCPRDRGRRDGDAGLPRSRRGLGIPPRCPPVLTLRREGGGHGTATGQSDRGRVPVLLPGQGRFQAFRGGS